MRKKYENNARFTGSAHRNSTDTREFKLLVIEKDDFLRSIFNFSIPAQNSILIWSYG
jgi:hypothetical protein